MIEPIQLPKIEYGEGLTHLGQAFNQLIASNGIVKPLMPYRPEQPKVNAVETFRKDWEQNKKQIKNYDNN